MRQQQREQPSGAAFPPTAPELPEPPAPDQLKRGQSTTAKPAGQASQWPVQRQHTSPDTDPEQRRPFQKQFGSPPEQRQQQHDGEPPAPFPEPAHPRQQGPEQQQQGCGNAAAQPERNSHRQAEPGRQAHPGEWMQAKNPAVADQDGKHPPERRIPRSVRQRPQQGQGRNHRQRTGDPRGQSGQDSTQNTSQQRLGSEIAHGQRCAAASS